MAKFPQPAASSHADGASAKEPKLTLTEFCIRLSANVRRPELLGAFEFSEKRAGHLKDTEKAFAQRFEAFKNKPV